jgi:putative methyltransferase (TIGR04325 family)
VRRLVGHVLDLLPRDVRERRYARYFARARQKGLHYGVFPDFAAARAAIPPGRTVGYDHPHGADLSVPGGAHLLDAVNPRDYPVLYWLSRLFREGVASVFDFGGHVGVKYYAYRKYLPYPDGLRWIVCEVPTTVEAGRALARERPDTRGLAFTERMGDADGVDVFFAAGSLQYIETPLDRFLAGLPEPPPHLVLNGLPLTDGPGFVTLQNDGVGYSPYWIQNRGELVRGVEGLGYALEDTWAIPDKRCDIPFHEDRSVRGYTGFCFRRR